ncbi:MAG: DUF2127 domain-containing protein [bacterium]
MQPNKNIGYNWVHYTFLIGLIGKGLNAAMEIVGGLGLYFLNSDKILKIVARLTQEELIEDPRDKIASFLMQTAEQLSFDSRIFGSIYLLSHGLIKAALIWALLKKKLFAYPLAIVFFGLFILYQLYRFTYTHSPLLILLSILDIIIIIVTWLEYKRIKSL